MWKNRYHKIYKTKNPHLVITAVRNFPNINDTLEKNIAYYQVKELQKEPMFLDVVANFWWHHGNAFIPLYFSDDVPKLEKLQTLQPLGKGWFWCVGYREQGLESYIWHSYNWYVSRLHYMLDHHWEKNSGHINHLFLWAIKVWVYENSPEDTQRFKNRRFYMLENQSLTFDTYEIQREDYIRYLEKMETTNWYEFIFKAFAKN